MRDLWEKVKQFFCDKLNIAIMCLLVVFFVLIPFCKMAEFLIKVDIWVLSVVLAIIGYKMLKKYKSISEVNEIIDCTTQDQSTKNVFHTISDKYESYNRKSYLLYAIVFFGMAVMLIVYTIIR